MSNQWPQNWDRLVSGEDCGMCPGLGVERTQYGARIFEGEYSDTYLQSADIQRGYSLTMWKGRHVVEPTELSAAEATGYWLETLRVADALIKYYQPLKMNYETLGNSSPHLHTHLMPRYHEDPSPGQPFPNWPDDVPQMDETRFLTELEALRTILS
jgi:diadenosine tetraphosphate (Ap4A) HIT family hydrolase